MADNSNNIKKLYNDICNKVSLILVNDETVKLLKENEEFQKIINDYLCLINEFEKKLKIKDEKFQDLSKGYETISKKKVNIKAKVSIKDLDDVEDNVNYLEIFLTNTISKKLSDLKESYKTDVKDAKTAETEEIYESTRVVDGEEVHNFSNTKDKNNKTNANFDAEDYLRQNNVTPEIMAEQMLQQQASMLVNKDIMTGKFYKFDSKPKSVLILKIIYTVMFAIFAASFITLQFISLFAPQFAYEYETGKYRSFTDGGGAGIFQIVTLLLISGILFFKIYNDFKHFKNDNYRYSVKLTYTFLMLFIFILFISNYFSFFEFYNNPTFGEIKIPQTQPPPPAPSLPDIVLVNTNEAYVFQSAIYGLLIALIVVFILSVILSLVLKSIRPKVDIVRIQELTLKYVDDIKNKRVDPGTPGPSGPGGLFGGGNGRGGMLF